MLHTTRTFHRSFSITAATFFVVAVTSCSSSNDTPPPPPIPTDGPAGTSGVVYAFSAFDDGHGQALYVGGNFATAGNVTANSIARWNGSSWSALGGGVNDYVKDLAVFDNGSALYAVGNFTSAGGSAVNYVAKWNGSSWSRPPPSGAQLEPFHFATWFALIPSTYVNGPPTYSAGPNPSSKTAIEYEPWSASGTASSPIGDHLAPSNFSMCPVAPDQRSALQAYRIMALRPDR